MLFIGTRMHIIPNCAHLGRFGVDLPTRVPTAANHHKPPHKRRKYAEFETMGFPESMLLHRHGLDSFKEYSLDEILAFYQHTNNHHPKFWRWIAVICGGLRWFAWLPYPR